MWVQDDAKIHCNELANWATSSSKQSKLLDFLIKSEKLLPARESIFLSTFHVTTGFGLLVELVTSGAELSSDILADARDCASDAFEVLPLLH